MKTGYCWSGCVLGSLLLVAMAGIAHAQGNGTVQRADSNIHGDGTMSPAAAAAMTRGPLPMNDAEAAMKRAATRAAQDEAASRQAAPHSRLSAEAGEAGSARTAVVGGHSFAGLSATNSAPSSAAGAIGRFTYIQTVNSQVRIHNRNTHGVAATGTLNELAGNAPSVNSFYAQILWDPTTNRFYYAMTSVFSASDNRISFGFSKTPNPTSITGAHWCHYWFTPPDPARFPDGPALGDSTHFIIMGWNAFQPGFVGADLFAVAKPPAGTTCPAAAALKSKAAFDLRDSGSVQVFTPVPANQVDDNVVGHVVARNLSIPSDKLWFFRVIKDAGGFPAFGSARSLTVPSYTAPPDATQPGYTQVLDTLDSRPTQAVQAINPDRGSNIHSFWMQHTIKHATENRSVVRWYEVNPGAAPVLLRSGVIGQNSTGNFFFNAAISPDRRKDRTIAQFGDSFVIEYNQSSAINNVSPRIQAASSFNGGALTFLNVRNGVGPYRDFSCSSPGDDCRWGPSSSLAPDPKPTASGRGQVWGTNQYSGAVNPSTGAANFRTWIFALQP